MPDQTSPAPSDQTAADQVLPDQQRGDPHSNSQTTPKTGSSDAQTPVSDDAVQNDGSGQHGRPTDDSDPGHS